MKQTMFFILNFFEIQKLVMQYKKDCFEREIELFGLWSRKVSQ